MTGVVALLADLHQRFALALIAMAVILGLWGSYQFLRYRHVSGGFRSSFLLMFGLTAVQGLLGAAVMLAGTRPANTLHLVYGIFAVVFLPGLYFYARGSKDREAAFLAAACWIVAIAYGRGFMTGH